MILDSQEECQGSRKPIKVALCRPPVAHLEALQTGFETSNSIKVFATVVLVLNSLSSAWQAPAQLRHSFFINGLSSEYAVSHPPALMKQKGSSAKTKATPKQPLLSKSSWAPSSWPRLVVFDLDFTLWRPELFQLENPAEPLKLLESGGVETAAKERLDLFPAARLALRQLADANVAIAVASRTHRLKLAHELLRTVRVDEKRTMADCIRGPVVIRSGIKTVHFSQIQLESGGVPLESMVFFDNELGNIVDCEKLGVTCAYCPKGLTDDIFREGLERHAREEKQRLKSSFKKLSSKPAKRKKRKR